MVRLYLILLLLINKYSFKVIFPSQLSIQYGSWGSCNYDGDEEYTVWVGSAIAKAVMFDRTSGISCGECLQLCKEKQATNRLWQCSSVTYDYEWRICDLFAVNGNALPFFLVTYEQRDYFELKRMPLKSYKLSQKSSNNLPQPSSSHFIIQKKVNLTPTQSSNIDSETNLLTPPKYDTETEDNNSLNSQSPLPTQIGEKQYTERDKKCLPYIYLEFVGFMLKDGGDDSLTIKARSKKDCVLFCDEEENEFCKSALVGPNKCELSNVQANLRRMGDLVKVYRNDVSYLHKIITPSMDKCQFGGRRFLSILNGIAPSSDIINIISVASIDTCIDTCLNYYQENNQMKCTSVSWIPTNNLQNCHLSNTNYTTRNNLIKSTFSKSILERNTITYLVIMPFPITRGTFFRKSKPRFINISNLNKTAH